MWLTILTTLIGSLSPFLGIVGSLLPSIVKIFDRKQEIEYDLQLAKLKGDIAAATLNQETTLAQIQAITTERSALYAYDSGASGSIFIDALKASVRPVITYSFFFLFIAVKTAAAYTMLMAGTSVPSMLIAIWDPETMSLFSTIIAFWFGSRMFEKFSPASITSSTVTAPSSKKQ